MRAIRRLISCAVIIATAIGAPAHAQAQQTDLDARLTVLNGCFVSATDMDFGSPAPGATSVDSTATVTIVCTSPAVYRVYMDRGDNASGAQRRMRGTTGDFVNYGLFRNAARTQDWGNTLLTGRLGISLGATPTDYTAYGRIPVLNVAALQGSYLDTVAVTVAF